MRLFIAISLDPAIQTALGAFSRELKFSVGDSIRWVKPGNIHLTLKFLGEVDQEHFVTLQEQIKRIAPHFNPLDLVIKGCGVFPGWRQPHIVWVGVQAPDALSQLAGLMETELRQFGFAAEERAFSPHLTIGRVNNGITQPQVKSLQEHMKNEADRQFGLFRADHLTLYWSELRPEGPIYTELMRASFSTQ